MTMTLKELSRLLGLSQTTVSRALNGYPEVNEQTRQRVLAAAQTHNYAPNPRAKGLATGRAMAIGHILPMLGPEVVNPIFGDFLAAAGTVYARRGYAVHMSFVEPGGEAELYRRLRDQHIVDAILLHSPRRDDPRPGLLRDLGLPFGMHGRTDPEAFAYNFVDTDNHATTSLAVAHLAGLGHRRIALLNGPQGLIFARARREGYLGALERAGIPVDPGLIHHAEMTDAYGYATAKALLAGPTPPTAFFAGSILVAIGVQRAVIQAGLSLGRDVSLVTHDDDLSYLSNRGDPPGFTATRSSVQEAGTLLADILIDQIENPEQEPQGMVLEPTLIQGLSSGPAPA